MTSPNQPAPDGSFVVGDDYGQDITEDQFRQMFEIPRPTLQDGLDIMRDQLLKLPLEALEAFKTLIPDWVEEDFASVGRAVNKIMSILIAPIRFLLETDWLTWLSDTWEFFRSMVMQVIDILRGITIVPITNAIQEVKDWFEGLTGWRLARESDIATLSSFTTTEAARTTRNPKWICDWPIGDVTYPQIFLMSQDVYTEQNIGVAGGGSYIPMGSLMGITGAGGYSLPSGYARGGSIPISQTAILDTLVASVFYTGGTNIGAIYLDLWKIDPNGSASRVYTSGDVSGQLTSRPQDQSVLLKAPIPGGIITVEGEEYGAVIRREGGNPDHAVFGMYWDTDGRVSAPKMAFELTSNRQASSLTASQVQTARNSSHYVYWLALVRDQDIPQSLFHADDFNRSQIGDQWLLRSNAGNNQLRIFNNRVTFNGTTDGQQNGLYIKPVNTDTMRVSASVYDVTTTRCGLLLCSDASMSNMVYIGINLNTARLFTGSYGDMTERATANEGGDGLWSAIYNQTSNTYNVYRGTNHVLSWTDSNNVIRHGSGQRFGGIRVARSFFINSGRLDNFTLSDWEPS